MSKDEFKKRLLRKYSTPEERRTLYGNMVNHTKTLLEKYDNKSETEQVVAIRNMIKLIYNGITVGRPFIYSIFGAMGGVLGDMAARHIINSDKLPNTAVGIGIGTAVGLHRALRDKKKYYSEFMKKTGLDKV